MTGEIEAGAVRGWQSRLELKSSGKSKRPPDMRKWLEREIWPHIPEEELDKPPMTKAEVEEILGYGPDGF
jgi:antitoxin VapB